MARIRIHAASPDYAGYLQCLVGQLGIRAEVDLRDTPGPRSPRRKRPMLTIVETSDGVLPDTLQPDPRSPVILICDHLPEDPAPDSACVCFRKPLIQARFIEAVGDRLALLAPGASRRPVFEPYLIGNSKAIQAVRQTLERISGTDLAVLIGGETGTGKGLLALAIHNNSPRRFDPFLEVNCSNIPATLLESELFGYKKGAFTGAWDDKPGKFDLADGGTIFLDEISEMTTTMQAKLLQVLQDGRFSAIGSCDTTAVNVRLLSASNAALQDLVEDGRFRRDLFFRLNVIEVRLPPLRERREDIGVLKEHFLEKYSMLYNRPPIKLSKDLCSLLEAYHWPGNVRELENTLKTCVAVGNESIVCEELGKKCGALRRRRASWRMPATLQQDIGRVSLRDISRQVGEAAEKDAIEEMLVEMKGNKKATSKALAVSYKSLLTKIKQYGLQ